MNFGFVIDNRKCIGCHACTVACKAEHEVPVGVNRTWVKYIEKGTFPDTRRLFSVMRCNHCADAPCVEICPVTALFTRKDGIVDFDDRRCIGCKACTQACPYDALYMHPDTHTSAKCNYCTHRVDIGLEPACVNVCPEHAIISGDMDNPSSEISQLLARETVSVRKPEKGTNPKLFYIDGDKASLDPTAANPDTDYMWSSQSSGVGHFARFADAKARSGRNAGPTVGTAQRPADANRLVNIEGRGVAGETPAVQSPRRVYDAPNKGVLWGWEVSAYILTKAIAAGAFLVPIVPSYFVDVQPRVKLISALVALVFLAITGALLVMDLGRPERFIYTLLRPQWRSWLTRGAYIITGYGGLLTVWVVLSYLGCVAPLKFIEPVLIVLALLTAVYTAFLFAQAKGRDFWQSPMLGLHMIIHAVLAGAAAFFVMSGLRSYFSLSWLPNWPPTNAGGSDIFVYLAVGSIVLHLVTLAIELTMTHSTADAHAVAKMITDGEFANKFWFGMVFVGNILPLMSLLLGPQAAIAPAGIVILIGLWFAEDIWVKAPQQIPLA
ncbi:MAG: polysulfide reductase NrfD [Acidobacteria bacterium]|nr:polysulfide reductase NrfD [Acidobacteriota bacterium]